MSYVFTVTDTRKEPWITKTLNARRIPPPPHGNEDSVIASLKSQGLCLVVYARPTGADETVTLVATGTDAATYVMAPYPCGFFAASIKTIAAAYPETASLWA